MVLAPYRFLRIGFQEYQPNYQGFVAAKSYNQKHAVQINEQVDFFVNPKLVLVNMGTQPLPNEIQVESREEKELAFTWSIEAPFEYNDHVMILAYDVDSEEVHARIRTSLGLRKHGSAIFKLEKSEKGRSFHIYIAFVAEDRKQRTNSKYLGNLKII